MTLECTDQNFHDPSHLLEFDQEMGRPVATDAERTASALRSLGYYVTAGELEKLRPHAQEGRA